MQSFRSWRALGCWGKLTNWKKDRTLSQLRTVKDDTCMQQREAKQDMNETYRTISALVDDADSTPRYIYWCKPTNGRDPTLKAGSPDPCKKGARALWKLSPLKGTASDTFTIQLPSQEYLVVNFNSAIAPRPFFHTTCTLGQENIAYVYEILGTKYHNFRVKKPKEDVYYYWFLSKINETNFNIQLQQSRPIAFLLHQEAPCST